MLQKIGICCSLFLAVFPVKNYAMDAEIINAASFTYVRNHRSAVETRDLSEESMSSSSQMPLPPSDDSYQFDDQYSYQPAPDYQYPYQLMPDYYQYSYQPAPDYYQYPYQLIPDYYQYLYQPVPDSQPPESVYDQISQNETYVFRDTEEGKRWMTSDGKVLDIPILCDHLPTQGNDVFKELSRFILIQNSANGNDGLLIDYNCPANNSVKYFEDKMDDCKKDLRSTSEMNYFVDRIMMRNNGIMSESLPKYGVNRSGVFHVSEGENLRTVAMNILEYLFSENIQVNKIEKGDSGTTFHIDFTYQGRPIPGLKHDDSDKNFYLDDDKTNNLRIVFALSRRGSIHLKNMFFYLSRYKHKRSDS